jgi:hypothetical protein
MGKNLTQAKSEYALLPAALIQRHYVSSGMAAHCLVSLFQTLGSQKITLMLLRSVQI